MDIGIDSQIKFTATNTSVGKWDVPFKYVETIMLYLYAILILSGFLVKHVIHSEQYFVYATSFYMVDDWSFIVDESEGTASPTVK